MLVGELNSLKIPDRFSDIFAYNPSNRHKAAIKNQKVTSKTIYHFQENTFAGEGESFMNQIIEILAF
jgi:hypothetical protein